MITTSWRYKIQLVTVAAMVALGSATAGAAQYIDTGTPASTEEADADGSWGDLAPSLTGNDAAVIEGDVYVLPSSGAEVVVASGVTVSSDEGQVEDQIIFETNSGIGAIGVLEVMARPEAVRDNYVGGFSESMDSIDELVVDATSQQATGIYVFESAGLPLYMYISVDAAVVPDHMLIEVFIGQPEDMADGIALSRENVSVEGVAMFKDVDEQDIADVILREEG